LGLSVPLLDELAARKSGSGSEQQVQQQLLLGECL
jgi:hypothetical protein